MPIAGGHSSLKISLLAGVCITVVGGSLSFIFPTLAYVLSPGMLVVYILSGGVHGYSSGVYLPSLPVWYALGGLIDVVLFSFFWLSALKVLATRKKSGVL